MCAVAFLMPRLIISFICLSFHCQSVFFDRMHQQPVKALLMVVCYLFTNRFHTENKIYDMADPDDCQNDPANYHFFHHEETDGH